jgi:AraC-like DNA-binding protein
MTKGEFRFRASTIHGIELVDARTDHVFPRHTHQQFGVGVILGGAQRSHSGRGQVDAVSGDVITVNPGEVHDGEPIAGHPRSWAMIYIEPDVMSDFHHAMADVGTREEFHHPVLRDRQIAARCRQLLAALDPTNRSSRLEAESCLVALLADLMTERQSALVPHFTAAVRRACTAIDDAPTQPLTLADLAAAAGLSRFQVLRGFVRETGMTPHAYQMQRRVDLAMRLIRRGLRLADVAADSGFADQSHMTRAFSARYGVTPGIYARSIG